MNPSANASPRPIAAASAGEILRARARELARVPAAVQTAPAIEVLEFHLAQETYAVETRWVREVSQFRDLTPLPGAPAFVRGIVNARGRILPVFDLKKFFDLPEPGLVDLHRIVFLHGCGLELGLLADIVIGVRTLRVDELQPALPTLSGVRAEYLKGVAPGPIVVLDVERILTTPKIVVDDGG